MNIVKWRKVKLTHTHTHNQHKEKYESETNINKKQLEKLDKSVKSKTLTFSPAHREKKNRDLFIFRWNKSYNR